MLQLQEVQEGGIAGHLKKFWLKKIIPMIDDNLPDNFQIVSIEAWAGSINGR